MATQPATNASSEVDPYGLQPPTSKKQICFIMLFTFLWMCVSSGLVTSLVAVRAGRNMRALCTSADTQHCLRAVAFGITGLVLLMVAISVALLFVFLGNYQLARFDDHNKDILVLRSDRQYTDQQRKAHEAANQQRSRIRSSLSPVFAVALFLALIAFLIYNS